MKKTDDEKTEVKSGDAALSHSKQKRIERQKSENARKRNSLILKIVGIVLAAVVVGLIVWRITAAVIKSASVINASDDFSAQLEDTGFIKGVKASDYITLCDYKNIKVPLSEVEYPDESVEEDIQTALEGHQSLATEDVEVKDGDKVNIDYVGTIDGEEFDGGNSNGEGYDLTIGSGSFIDDFEQQLIGYKPGEVVTVDVTFPDDYATADLAGKDAEFTVNINGVYVNPEFDDDFVCAYYSDVASTADEYRQYLKDTNYDSNLTEYITNYLNDNSTVNKYPKKYLKNVEETTKYTDEQTYEYMNQMYQEYYGSGYSSFEEYTGMTEEEYNAQLLEDAQTTVKSNLIYQAILESEGITPTDEDLKANIADSYGSDEDTYDSEVERYGKGYLQLSVIEEKAIEIAKSNAVVE